MIKIGNDFCLNASSQKNELIPFKFLWVEPGEFTMGPLKKEDLQSNIFDKERTVHSGNFDVKITKGFWLGQYLVSQSQWETFGKIKSKMIYEWQNKDNEDKKSQWRENNRLPIYGVSWIEAMKFCHNLNKKFTEMIPYGYHFSLPTEVHWEYVCKNGDLSESQSYSDEKYWDLFKTSLINEVGASKPNSLGFHDMLGSIREMCYDISSYYPAILDSTQIPFDEGKFLDWVGNMIPDDWFPDLPSCFGEIHIVRGAIAPFYREFRLPYYNSDPIVGFRVALRAIMQYKNCDLDDPLLKKEGINILGND